jgi:hypothetical protein
MLIKCRSFHAVPLVWYNYRLRDGSITTTKTLYNFQCYGDVALRQSKIAALYPEDSAEYKFMLRCSMGNFEQAMHGIEKYAKPLYMIEDARKFRGVMGFKELM